MPHVGRAQGKNKLIKEQTMKKVQRKSKSFFFLATLLMTCCALIFSVLSSCKDTEKDGPSEAGSEAGTWYYDYEGDQNREYRLTLADGLKFTFVPAEGDSRIGTYTLNGGSLTLTDGDWTQTATYDESSETISMTYDSAQMRFIRRTPYTVTYDTAGGSSIASTTVINGRMPVKPADPTRSEYVFAGWFADSGYTTPYNFGTTPVTENITVHALWLPDPADIEEFTVTFDLGYEGAEKLPATETIGGKLYDTPVPEREGYSFEGWWLSMDNDGERLTSKFATPDTTGEGGTAFDSDTTLFALWHDDDATLAAAPEVSVTDENASWNSVAGATDYLVTITAPDGTKPYDGARITTTSMSMESVYTANGVYKIEVTAAAAGAISETAVRYYTYGALDRVAHIRVMEPDVLVYSGVEGAEKYTITVDCGNPLHNHTAYDNGTSLYFNFANCDMKEGGIKFVIMASAGGYASSSSTFVFERNLGKVNNLDIADDVAVWDAVDGAAYYDVTLGEQTFSTTGTSFSLKYMSAGEYDISVTPVAKGYNSPEASTISYEKTSPALPSDIRLVGDILTWTADADAEYAVVYGNRTAELEKGSDSIDLSTLDGLTWTAEAEYTVQLRVTKGGEEALSEQFVFVNRALDPTLLYNNGTLSWKAVAGASEYRLTVNGVQIAVIKDGSTNYKFDSLDKEGVNVMEVTFVDSDGVESEAATLEVFAHSITFNSDGNRTTTIYKAVGDELNAPEANLKVGYEFAAWYNTPAGPASNGAAYTNPFFAGPSDLVLYAYYQPRNYTVIYDGDDLGELTGSTVTFGQDFKLDVPETSVGTRVFGGWFSSPYGQGRQLTDADGNSVAAWSDPTDNVRVYAFWVDEALEYEMLEGTYVVRAGRRISSTASVTIPSTYNGIAVTELDAAAFADCTTLTTINIPDTIQVIPVGAFEGCDNLQAINIYDANAAYARYSSDNGVLYDRGAFGAQHGMRPMFIPSTVSGTFTIPDGVDVIPREAFKNSMISRVIIPESVTTIESEAFANCIKLSSVVFVNPKSASGTLTVGARAFMNCEALTTITFPARLSSLAIDRIGTDDISYGFDDMTSYSEDAFLQYWDGLPGDWDDVYCRFAELNVEAGGKYYKSIDGVLYNAAGTELLYVPAYYDTTDFEIPATVTTIGRGAFVGARIEDTFTITANVTTIKEFAFAGNSYLTTLIFEGSALAQPVTIGDYAFMECDLEDIVFADDSNVTTIGAGAFMDNEYLGGHYSEGPLTIPATVTEIGDIAFAYSDDYGKELDIVFEDGDEPLEFGKNVFLYCNIEVLTIPARAVITSSFFDNLNAAQINVDSDYVKTIGDGVYFMVNGTPDTLVKYQGSGDSFVIEAGTKNIASGVFRDNEDLRSVTIPSSVTSIGSYAFNESYYLSEVIFEGESTEALSIGDHAFYGVEFEALTLPNRPITIGDYAFADNGELRELDLGGTVSIGAYAFNETGYYDDWNEIAALNVTIPASVTTIGESAFEGYSWGAKVGSVTLAEGSKLTTIGERAFAVSGITSLTVPATVTNIGAGAFADCENLESFTFAAGDANSPDLIFGDPTLSYDEDRRPTGENYSVLYGTAVTAIEFPARLTQIGLGALSEMSDYYGDKLEVTFAEGSKLQTINPYAFYSSGVGDIVLPSSVLLVGDSAFYYSSFGSISFASGGTGELTIGEYAFIDSSMTSLSLPKNLAVMSINALIDPRSGSNCGALEEIIVEAGCAAFATYDGALYTAGCEELLCVPAAKTTLEVSANAESIAADAAYDTQLTDITFAGNALLSIGDGAFANCRNLEEIALPDSVTTLGDDIFSGCNNLVGIVLPANLEAFSSSMLGCDYLEKFIINDGEKFTTDEAGGAIYTADMDKLIYYLPTRTDESYTVPEGVVEIDSGAFANATYLVNVTLPSTLERIGANAFYFCDSLENVTFASGGSELLVIEQSAFQYTAITRVDLPSRISAIGDYAFEGLDDLAIVTFGGSASRLDSIGASAFANTAISSLVLPASVRTVDNRAFAGCESLASVTLNEGLTTLGDEVFAFGDQYTSDPSSVTTNLKTITMPSTLSSVGSHLFWNCNQLTLVDFAAGSIIQTLPGDMFEGCISLTSIRLPASLTSISNGLFRDIASLTSVTFEDGSRCVEIGSYAFDGTGLQSFDIPNTVISIGDSAFSDTDLSEINIPRTVTSIGENAFSSCSKLTIARIEALVTELPFGVFQNCPGLTTITLPATLSSISDNCFTNSKNIELVTVAAGNPYFVIDEMSGALYNANMTEIYLLPVNSEYEIPTTLKTDTDTLLAVLGNCAALEWVSVEEGSSLYNAFEGALYDADWNLLFVPASLSQFVVPDEKQSFSDDELELLGEVTTLEEVTVESTANFNAYAGVLYDAEWNPVLVPSALTEYEIPAAVTVLDTDLLALSNIVTVTYQDRTTALTIGANVFNGIATLESVSLPANTAIGDDAFANNANLTTVILTEGTSGSIGANAFKNSPVADFDLVEGITFVGNNAFSGTVFTKLTLPESLKSLETGSLAGSAIEEFVIKDPANFIFEGGMLYNGDKTKVYYYSPELSTITISASETDMAIFDQLSVITFLKEVVVEEGNPVFQSAFGAVYDMDWNLLFVPSAMTTFTIPKEMTHIGGESWNDGASPLAGSAITTIVSEAGAGDTLEIEGIYVEDISYYDKLSAFFGMEYLTSVTLPTDRDVIIGEYAFAVYYDYDDEVYPDCRNIESIYLGENVIEVGESAFENWGYYRVTDVKNVSISVWFDENDTPSNWNYYWKYNAYCDINYGVA